DVSRRSFVQAGVLGMGGLNLAELLRLKAQATRPSSISPERKTSVILFWLSGGPGHMETWDPKPEAPAEFRGPFGATPTNVPGVQFGELMPQLAERMDKLAILRSVNHGSGDHTKANHWMLTGFEGPAFNAPDFREQRRPSMGSAVSAVGGANHSSMPAYVAVPHLRGGTDNFFHYSAYLGGGYNPFVVNSDPNSKDFSVRNLSLPVGLTQPRLEDRLELLQSMDRLKRNRESQMVDLDQHHQKAFDLLTSRRVRDAFDIEAEDIGTRKSYGLHTFGQSALVARRLVERGVTFVTVNCVPWDHHGSSNRYQTEEGSKLLIPPLDVAISGLIDDLEQRGLYEDTMVIAMGEFGRTPRMNKYAGRDHWGNTFSVLVGCGSMNMGQVIGRSTSNGTNVASRPLSPEDVSATVYHHLGIDGEFTMLNDLLDRPMPLIAEGKPIRELFY
ncbi:MAG TPA: DUF1501 domain-containing protein, partial [Planctomycetaceae bacterium]|nr:DUF1501 domain-containing protein [Planctomycetaceae bacterium]